MAPDIAALSFLLSVSTTADLSHHVKVFAGTLNGGNNFPGVARPFGMVKLGPDLLNIGTDSYSGYLANGNFSGFSLMHEQGTGGAPKYGTPAQLPLVGTISNPLSSITVPRSSKPDEGSVGYYKATTGQDVVVELAASERAGMFKYTFPAGSTRNNILVDVSHVLPSFRGQGLGQGYAGGEFQIMSDGHYEASGVYNNGWNRSPDWTIYSCGYFNTTPTTASSFVGPVVVRGVASSTSSSVPVGGLFTFDEGAVLSRVGISWISKEQACRNVNEQIPETATFDNVVQATKDAWNSQIFSKVTTTSTNASNLELLYTSLYHMNLLPTNKTGENPGWESTEPYYDDIFTFWDTFRYSTALLQIIQPTMYEEFIRSTIDIWRHDGYLPDGRSSNYNGRTQGGSNADNVLADAYVKSVRGKVNWEDGYAAMVKDAEVPPPNTNPPDPMAPEASTKEGRGALPDWLKYGFITTKFSRSASRAVEYAYNDFSLYQVAKGLNKTADAAKYLTRSRNWRNHWNPKQTAIGFSGFVVPRNETDFLPVNPLTDAGYWGDATYQVTSWGNSFGDIHDMAKLVELMGGRDTFLARLDATFTPGANPANPNGVLFDATNEPTFNIPYLYTYISLPNHSVQRSRHIAKTLYTTTPTGLPGNSDAGAMQSWLLWNIIGLYPVTGQTTFLIHAPWFESLTLELGEGKRLVVTSEGGDGTGDSRIYVQSVRVNGVSWEKSWLVWEDVFAEGGTLHFVLGEEMVEWAKGEVPPSPAS
ncbi:Six-hairpin glycosidase [Glarea lozoyensis ATCC 20868]|uniref:Six-hairpin glycosidase n=1 Tax=Glarea lozoyensis (strain ATCC 20868 / MF5171) TaxID=1116229 RepID=S3CZA3_GLAL2|nr:Six-hairpin glycosidase [Glarea lozoyensis ATCC 20868]EPE25166.1 Six-hairpin glycosidase [Glarea lozoyensis ATCC 20868]